MTTRNAVLLATTITALLTRRLDATHAETIRQAAYDDGYLDGQESRVALAIDGPAHQL